MMMGRYDCQKKKPGRLRLYSRRLCKIRGQRRGPQNGVSASALQKRREETREHPRDSQEEQGHEESIPLGTAAESKHTRVPGGSWLVPCKAEREGKLRIQNQRRAGASGSV